jgi:protein gp37
MGEKTKIAWCDHTFNPWYGCTEVSAACDFCYARVMMQDRYHKVEWGNHPRVRTLVNNWKEPLRWNRNAERDGARRKVFCASLADVFDNQVDFMWRRNLYHLIEDTPHLDWLLLTKRPQNIRDMLPTAYGIINPWPWPNIWLGTTVENQTEADRRIPQLLTVPAAKRFLSCEPLLGPINLDEWMDDSRLSGDGLKYKDAPIAGLDWVICGGESGPRARPMHPDWARSLRDQCAADAVPFFFKQWGEWLPGENHGKPLAEWQDGSQGCDCPPSREWRHFGTPGEYGAFAVRVGKKRAGALLDGVEHRGVPG